MSLLFSCDKNSRQLFLIIFNYYLPRYCCSPNIYIIKIAARKH